MFGFAFRQKKPVSAQTAKERLQIMLAHEKAGNSTSPDFLPMLQRDILEVVRRHLEIGLDDVEVKMERSDDLSSLEINIELPGTEKLKVRKIG